MNIESKLYKSKIKSVKYTHNTNETTIFFNNAEKKNKRDFFSVKGKLSFCLTEHNLLKYLMNKGVLLKKH